MSVQCRSSIHVQPFREACTSLSAPHLTAWQKVEGRLRVSEAWRSPVLGQETRDLWDTQGHLPQGVKILVYL